MKFSFGGAVGSIIGWFVISPLFSSECSVQLVDKLSHTILGLLVAIGFGFLFGVLFER